jgi:diacylglycerol kinase family enzyme
VKPARHLDVRVGVRHLVIEHDTPFPYQVDGDALGDTRRLEFDYVPDAVKLVFPRQPERQPETSSPSTSNDH